MQRVPTTTPLIFKLGLGLVATALLLPVMGCGSANDTDQSVVVAEPGTTPSGGGAAPAATGPETAAAPDAADAPAAGPRQVVEGFGTLKGRIVYDGDPPERRVRIATGEASKDPMVCAAHEPILSEYLIVNPENQGVKNVAVFIPRPTAVSPEAESAAQADEMIFDQENCIFEPHVMAIMAGTNVLVTSSDEVAHNVNINFRSNARFNQSLSPGGEMTMAVDYAERGPIEVVCDIHPWMKAWWLVVDSPYFAITDENGEFEIPNVPAGTQDVVLWHEATDYITRRNGDPIDVEKDGETELTQYSIDPGQVKPEPTN